ncbi:hypothetical protein EDB81DRAFT_758240 [Dactylonectria macrodidyma]|uniref:Uncharacterized protein n=1 Tax=Dactylonectria macrodidyma TaxID=307937 RepID=A0A9P9F6T8_9HYPO|nr:hypothetical protein EDB81DRAFT_758240 [Dactylonectria macrodidyma]
MAKITEVEDELAKLSREYDELRIRSKDKAVELGYSVKTSELVQQMDDEVTDKYENVKPLYNSYTEAKDAVKHLQALKDRVALHGNDKSHDKSAAKAALSIFEFLLDEMPDFHAFLRVAEIQVPSAVQEAMEKAAVAVRSVPDSQLRNGENTPQPTHMNLKATIEELTAQVNMAKQRVEFQDESIQRLNSELSKCRSNLEVVTAQKVQADEELAQLRQVITSQNEELMELRMRKKDQEVVSKLQEEISNLNKTIENLETVENSRSNTLSERENEVKSQALVIEEQAEMIQTKTQDIDRAIAFIALVSVGTDSDISPLMMDNVRRDPYMLPSLKPLSRPWTSASWTLNAGLTIRPDDHGIHGTALDLLAILRSQSRMGLLLTCLHGLREALADGSPFLRCIFMMLLESFIEAMSNPALHIMHRLLMCQIASACRGWGGDRLIHLLHAVRIFDPRTADLFEALSNWGGAHFPLSNSLNLPEQGMVLVGFGLEACGLLMLRMREAEFVWISTDHAVHVWPTTGEIVRLEVDAPEAAVWCTRNI